VDFFENFGFSRQLVVDMVKASCPTYLSSVEDSVYVAADRACILEECSEFHVGGNELVHLQHQPECMGIAGSVSGSTRASSTAVIPSFHGFVGRCLIPEDGNRLTGNDSPTRKILFLALPVGAVLADIQDDDLNHAVAETRALHDVDTAPASAPPPALHSAPQPGAPPPAPDGAPLPNNGHVVDILPGPAEPPTPLPTPLPTATATATEDMAPTIEQAATKDEDTAMDEDEAGEAATARATFVVDVNPSPTPLATAAAMATAMFVDDAMVIPAALPGAVKVFVPWQPVQRFGDLCCGQDTIACVLGYAVFTDMEYTFRKYMKIVATLVSEEAVRLVDGASTVEAAVSALQGSKLAAMPSYVQLPRDSAWRFDSLDFATALQGAFTKVTTTPSGVPKKKNTSEEETVVAAVQVD
jgi:hypothetical protein